MRESPQFMLTESVDGVKPKLPDHLPLLERGAHLPGAGRACAMEAASWLAGERWSDHPRSVNRAIASIGRWVNDAVDDDERQELWPLILASLDTASSGGRINWRLRRLTREAGCRAVTGGRPSDAWEEVLAEYFRLTGRRPVGVQSSRISELSEHLRSTPRS